MSRKYSILFGIFSVSSAALLLFQMSNLGPVVDEKIGPKPLQLPIITRLRSTWNSEGVANWPVAETLVLVCQNAYQSPIDAEQEYLKWGFEEVKTFVHGSMVGYVVSTGDVCVVVFRGTDDDLDWFTNLNNFTTTTPKGEIHTGFYTAYISLKTQIDQLISRRQPKHLWITGHSLGGALALICAYDNQVFDGVITFGQPMVASPELATYLDKALVGRYAHYVNHADIVPHIPPFFKHCGSLVWFTDAGIKRSLPKLVGSAPIPGKLALVEDHSIDLYLEQIRAIALKERES